MNLQQFKDDFASFKGFKDFAEMTIKTLVTNEDWIGYDNLINEMMKLFSHSCIKEFDFTDIKTHEI